jgi:hypothetical protein
MCHAACDPKYAMRDIEARLKPVAKVQDKSEEAAEPAPAGRFARAGRALARWFGKEAGYV